MESHAKWNVLGGCMLGLVQLIFAGPAWSQTLEDIEPGFTGAVATGILYDDNIGKTENFRQADTAFLLAPTLGHRTVWSKHYLALDYFGAYAIYDDQSDENYDDHDLAADLNLDVHPKITVNAQAGRTWAHDLRGSSGARVLQSNKPDLWENDRLSASLTYGRPTNVGQVVLSLEHNDREYTNNNQQSRDRDSNQIAASFFYNVTAKTSWLFEVRHMIFDYVSAGVAELDSKEQRYLMGVRWEATDLTAGEIRLGQLKKEFDDATLNDFSGFTIEGDVSWTPNEIDNIRLHLLRATNESTQSTASYYVTTSINVTWSHVLTELWSYQVIANLSTAKFSDRREDNNNFYSVGLIYDWSERLGLDIKYTYAERDSNATGLNFENNKILVTLIMQPG